MAKFRYSINSKETLKFTHKNGDTLKEILIDALDRKNIPFNEKTEKFFVIFVNGKRYEKEVWELYKPTESDEIVISVIPKDDFGAILITVVVGLIFPAAIGLISWAAVGQAAIGIGVSLLLGALIKPPSEQTGGSPDYQDSQMYSITSQSNQMTKYGNVPRVYGEHRVFPLVAANPYTELENDPVTKELVQFYYAVYDFGYGPLDIQDIRIGDTPITSFNFVDYKLVDFNRPQIPEGVWDDTHDNKLSWYKGDVTQTDISAIINKNQEEAGATPDQYQVTRNASINVQNSNQHIIVTLVAPQGLASFNTTGGRGTRNIDLKVEFSEEATNDWRDFDDLNYVYDFNDPFDEEYVNIFGESLYNEYFGYPNLIKLHANTEETIGYNPDYDKWANSAGLDSAWFEPNGSIYIYKRLTWRSSISRSRLVLVGRYPVGTILKLNGVSIGEVYSSDHVSGNIYSHHLVNTTNYDFFYEFVKYDPNDFAGTANYYYKDFKGYGTTGIPHPAIDIDPRVSTLKINTFQGGNTKISSSIQKPVYAVYKFSPITKNRIKVRITRIRSYSQFAYNHQVIDGLTWASLTTRFDSEPITTKERHTFLELRIKATDQINGAIQNLSAIAKSYLQVYDPITQTWDYQLTSNPAWVFCDLITGRVNKRSVDKSRIDTDSILEWANYCDEIPTAPLSYGTFYKSRFECNFILDYSTTLAQALNSVGSSAQASLNMINGKYGVLIDKVKTIPVQIFTPRNSSDFAAERNYVEVPNALKIKYVDPGSNWEQKERIVYNDGFNEATAETFEEMETFACTNNEQAWRFGRYNLAQLKLRQEIFSINVDFEHLICTRGDYVLLTQDVMKIGGFPARVKTRVGNQITIDDSIITIPATSYGYTARDSFGVIFSNTLTVISPNTFNLDGTLPEPGDIIVIGEIGKITYECIVRSIVPNDDLSAGLQLVEKNNAIFDAESSDNIPAYDPKISEVRDIALSAPGPVTNLTVDENSWDCDGRSYFYFIDLSWDIPLGTIYETFEIYVNTGNGFKLNTYTGENSFRYIVDQNNLGIIHSFKVLAVNSEGAKISLGEALTVSATPVIKTTPPSDVNGLFINILNETLQLDWPSVSDCDIENYLIRFSPQLNARWDNSVPILTVDRNNSQASIPARTGTYLIKARDFNLNESENAALAITSIPELVNLNIIDTTNDFPTFLGSLDQVINISDALLIDEKIPGGVGVVEYYSEGNYYYDSFLDLGEIYTVRLQSLIEAEGYSKQDLMSNWATLADLAAMSITDASEWGVETYYRGTNSFNVMADWTSLDVINSLSEGSPDAWTDWRKFQSGDFTARIFQFRLKLISNKADVTPRVFDAKIKSDMPDRVESGENILIPNTGKRINYPLAFKGPGTTPNIQVTIDNAQSGDRAILSNKDLTGFDIIILDSGDIAVQRQIDYVAKGYGRKQTATI